MRLILLPALVTMTAGCAGLVALPLAPAAAVAPASSGSGCRAALTVVLAPSIPRPDDARAAIQKSLGGSFDLTFASPPVVPASPRDTAPIEEELAKMRTAYINADFNACLGRAGEL